MSEKKSSAFKPNREIATIFGIFVAGIWGAGGLGYFTGRIDGRAQADAACLNAATDNNPSLAFVPVSQSQIERVRQDAAGSRDDAAALKAAGLSAILGYLEGDEPRQVQVRSRLPKKDEGASADALMLGEAIRDATLDGRVQILAPERDSDQFGPQSPLAVVIRKPTC